MRQRRPKGKRKTTCSGCGKEVEETRKGQRYCKSCHAASMRKNRPKHKDLSPDARRKANVRKTLSMAITRGRIKKQPCAECGEIKAEAHHPDYDKPFDVIWLCRKHHLELHKKMEKES